MILAGWILLRLVDDAQLNPMCSRRRHTRQREQSKPDRLKHALLSPMSIVALLNTGAQIELAPGHAIKLAIIVARLKRMTFREIEFPHVFPHRIPPDPASR